jgi:hypothetical protein
MEGCLTPSDFCCIISTGGFMKKFFVVIAAFLIAGLLLTGCGDEDNGGVSKEPAQGKLLILQAYGNGAADGDSPAGVSHSFVELYNISDEAIDLNGIGLYFADGIRGDDVTEDGPWKRLALSGSIPAKGSFLILGAKHSDLSATRYKIDDGYGDINDDALVLSRRGFKVALVRSQEPSLAVQNPFNDGKPVSGYIDMVGALNNPDANPPDHIFGYEKAPARCSASEAVRRRDRTDLDDNSTDFIAARYASGSGFTDEMLELRRPRKTVDGAWDPFAAPAEKPSTEGSMIFQVFGMYADNDSAPTHSFIELYNNSDVAIPLSSFSVHWANGISAAPLEQDVWYKINLTDNVPAKSSYLILGKQVVNIFTDDPPNGRLDLTGVTADLNDQDFKMSNRSYKIALMSNQNDITMANPWGMQECVDLVSAINTAGTDSVTAAKGEADLAAVNAASGGSRTISKQKSFRRTSLLVTDVTLTDFTSKAYNNLSLDDIEKFRPRTTADGAWTPGF